MLRKTILIIEDSADLADSLEDILSIKGFRSLKTNSGNTGLELIKKEKPDMVLLDLRLPDMNGIEIINKLRSDINTSDLPVLIVTASDQNDEIITKNNLKDFVIYKSQSSINAIVSRIEKELNKV